MRLVLDTNVLITAFIASGICADLFDHCARHHTLLTSDFILHELREQLTVKFHFDPEEVGEVVNLAVSRMVLVQPVDLPAQACRDPDDDRIIATAVAANCDCIVTGDKDLLVLWRSNDIQIVTPRPFFGLRGEPLNPIRS
ncbi:MAG: putative toxin-antitoxin system toxin component, PIN family [Methylococcales bacterium]